MDQNKTWDIAEHNILNKDMSKYVEYTWTHWCISSLNTSYQPLNIGRCNSDVAVHLIKTCICFCYLIKTCICFCSRKINYYNTNSKGKSAIVLPYVVLRCLSAVVLTCHI